MIASDVLIFPDLKLNSISPISCNAIQIIKLEWDFDH